MYKKNLDICLEYFNSTQSPWGGGDAERRKRGIKLSLVIGISCGGGEGGCPLLSS